MELTDQIEFVKAMRALGATYVETPDCVVEFGSVPETAKPEREEPRATTVREIAARQGIGPMPFPSRVE